MESSSPEEHTLDEAQAATRPVDAGGSEHPAGDSTTDGSPSVPRVEQQAEGEDYMRLEALLRERAEALRASEAEVTAIRALVRDALARFERLSGDGADPDPGAVQALREERDRAVARALEAEASRAEVMFRLDEVMGHLAAPDRSAELDVENARLTGVSRGLQAALAEAEEARDVAEARLMLAEADLEDAAQNGRGLERQLAEAREQLELELLKARAVGPRRTRSELQGERDGLRARADESERALAMSRARARSAERAAAETREQLGATRAELAETAMQRAVLTARVDELEQEREGGAQRAREVARELAEVQARLSERSEAFHRAEAELTELRDLRAGLEHAQREHDATLRAEREAAKRAQVAEQARRRQLADGLVEMRQLLTALSADVRDALGSVPVSLVSEGDDEGEPTLPGLPLHIEAVEALEEQVAEREGRIRQLQGQLTEAAEAHAAADEEHADTVARLEAERANLAESLAAARQRDQAVEAALRALRSAVEPGSGLETRIEELLGLLDA